MMIRKLLLAAALILAPSVSAQETLQTLGQKARAAREAKKYSAYLSAVEQMQAMLPGSPAMQYNMARAYALNARSGEAVQILQALADAGWGFDAASDAVLERIRTAPGFSEAAKKLVANNRPAPWRKLAPAGRQPEGLAAAADSILYNGALSAGIHRFHADGLTRVYTPLGGWDVVGLRIDAPRHELIACVSNIGS